MYSQQAVAAAVRNQKTVQVLDGSGVSFKVKALLAENEREFILEDTNGVRHAVSKFCSLLFK